MERNHSDALVFFGATGDLAYKKIFPALQAMVKHGTLDTPVIGVAKAGWDLDALKARARDSLEKHGTLTTDEEKAAWDKLQTLLRYVDGDYADTETFHAVKRELGSARSPAHYLAIPPSMFEVVVKQLEATGCAENARIIVEKPFGHDLASAQELNRILLAVFPESRIFRIDHYLAKGPVRNLVAFRFQNSILEPIWNRHYIESIQITMAEDFGIQGRGPFYDANGAIRDVVQNHIFQLMTNLVMEAPVDKSPESMRNEKYKVLRSIAPIDTRDVLRGQFVGYREEKGVSPTSDVETFAVLKLGIETWRWSGVPFYIRAGKNLPITCTELMVRLRRPPHTHLTEENVPQNYLRVRISPEVTIALAVSAAPPSGKGKRQLVEMVATRHPYEPEKEPYERVLNDAMEGDPTLFARQDYVEEAWRVVDPLLRDETPVQLYDKGTWGPESAALTPPGGWDNPKAEGPDDFRVVDA